MKLIEFKKQNRMTEREVSNLLGYSFGATVKWLQGNRIPGPEQMVRIFEVTNGLVQPNDFYDLPELPKQAEPQRDARQPAIAWEG